MKKTICKNNKGFSLVELLVTLAISALVILAAFTFVSVGVNSYTRTERNTSVQQEMSFTTNLFGESIRTADYGRTSISKWDDGDVEVHTGYKVFYYNKDKSTLYLYTEDPTKGVGNIYYKSDNSDNLVSKYIKSFDVDFENTDMAGSTFTYDSSNGYTVTSGSSLVKINLSVKVKKKTDTTSVLYEIRNSN